MSYSLFAAAVEVTSANNAIVFDEGAGDVTASITAGTYYLYNGTSADDLVAAVVAALNAASSTVTFSGSLAFSLDEGTQAATVTITGDGAATLKFGDGSTTFDATLLGFAATNTSSATSHAGGRSSPAVWVPNHEPEVDEQDEDEDVVEQQVAKSGKVTTWVGSAVTKTRRLSFPLLDGGRVKPQHTSVEGNAWVDFRRLARDGRAVRLYQQADDLDSLAAGDLSGTYVLTGEAIARVGAVASRVVPGRDLYDVGPILLREAL